MLWMTWSSESCQQVEPLSLQSTSILKQQQVKVIQPGVHNQDPTLVRRQEHFPTSKKVFNFQTIKI